MGVKGKIIKGYFVRVMSNEPYLADERSLWLGKLAHAMF